ncbi:MAG TPA: hypothetical protein VE173_08495, partial [Longimicrobiales bacterium]|nr:hypothetical protein [Longimicrobiales bacterium]
DLVAPDWAADVVWVDSLLTNPDRTHRNPNILVWRNRPWLIDHGAAVYVHHNWSRVDRAKMRTPFQPIGDHVLLGLAASVDDADVRMTEALEDGLLDNVVRTLPDALLTDPMAAGTDSDPDAERERYRSYLEARLEPPRAWVAEAERARVALRTSPPVRREARR